MALLRLRVPSIAASLASEWHGFLAALPFNMLLKKYHPSPCSHHHRPQSYFRQQLLFKVLYVSPSVVLPSSYPNFVSPDC